MTEQAKNEDYEITVEQIRAISSFLDGTLKKFVMQYLAQEKILNAYRAVTPKEYRDLAEPPLSNDSIIKIGGAQ